MVSDKHLACAGRTPDTPQSPLMQLTSILLIRLKANGNFSKAKFKVKVDFRMQAVCLWDFLLFALCFMPPVSDLQCATIKGDRKERR